LLTSLQANAFAPNWGQTIFQSANEMNQNIVLKNHIATIQAKLEPEKSAWEARRTDIQSNFMKELDMNGTAAENAPRKTGSESDDAVLVDAGGPALDQGSKKKKGKK